MLLICQKQVYQQHLSVSPCPCGNCEPGVRSSHAKTMAASYIGQELKEEALKEKERHITNLFCHMGKLASMDHIHSTAL